MKTIILITCLSLAVRASAYNLIHNGSFEIGASGWKSWGSYSSSSFGSEMSVAEDIVATNAVHGAHSLVFETRLLGRPFYIPSGTYTFTFSAMSEAAYSMRADIIWTYAIPTTPTPAFSVTTSWQRFTNTITITTNNWSCPMFRQPSAAHRTWIDAVQLEAGTNATAFAEGAVIQVGMDTTNNANVVWLGDSRLIRFNLWNDGPTTNATVHYEIISGLWNSNIVVGTVTTNALAGFTNTTINLQLPSLNGDLRLTCYVTNINETWDETSVAVLPYSAQSGVNTNGLLGLDSKWSLYHLNLARRIGFSWMRVFSQTPDARWVNVFPTLTTTNEVSPNIWPLDFTLSNIVSSGLSPLVTLVATFDHQWYPQTNASQAVMIGDYTNYVGRLVYRYNSAPYNIHAWEIFSEPQQNPRDAIALYDPVIYANLMTNTSHLIKAIDPLSFVVGFGGLSQESQGTNIWNNTPTPFKAEIDAVSFHVYPHASGDNDPNAIEDCLVDSTGNFSRIMAAFGGVKPVLNTETAVNDMGGYHTINVGYSYPYFYQDYEGWPSTGQHNELDCRQLPVSDRATYNFLQSVGNGMRQWNMQFQKPFDESSMAPDNGGSVSILELNGALKPWVVSLLIANNLVRTPGLGRVTVAGNYYVEAYLHTNDLGTVIPVWCFDRGNRTLSTTNAAFAQYDTMGNLIATNVTNIVVTRSPRYLVSGTLTTTQLLQTIQSATVATNVYANAPAVTIDASPIGLMTAWGGVTNVFKALAIDPTVCAYGWPVVAVTNNSQTNVLYTYTFDDGATWAPWSGTNLLFKSYAGPGNYRVGWKAKNALNTESPIAYTPYFGTLIPNDTSHVDIQAQANVGVFNITP